MKYKFRSLLKKEEGKDQVNKAVLIRGYEKLQFGSSSFYFLYLIYIF